MYHLVQILVPIACGCVLPIMIVWLTIRESMNKTNQRTKIEDFTQEETAEGETALKAVVG